MVRGESVCYLQHCSSSSAIFHTLTQKIQHWQKHWMLSGDLPLLLPSSYTCLMQVELLECWNRTIHITLSHLILSPHLFVSIYSMNMCDYGCAQMKRFHLILINNRTLLNANLINFSADCNNSIPFMAITIFFSIEWKKSSFE